MKIAIGTLNKAKNEAVMQVIQKIWPNSTYLPIETDSNISAQPLTNDEAITGAINRAKEALNKTNADIGIGLEGTVYENKHGMFLTRWSVIIDKKGKIGIGAGGSVQIPEKIRARLKKGEELGPITQAMHKDEKNEIRHTAGTNGMLTANNYTRIDEFKDSIKCALAPFLTDKYE